jgi:hypothetical protein
MVDAFISYRRNPSAVLAQLLQEKLRNRHGIDAYVDTTRADSSRVQFPSRLMQAIDDAPVFICLLAETTFESEWVRKEIERAYELKKRCIPVFQESFKTPSEADEAISYLLNFDGVHIFDVKSVFIDEAVEQISALIGQERRRDVPQRVLSGIVFLTLLAAAVGLIVTLNRTGAQEPSQDDLTGVVQEATDTTTPVQQITQTATQSLIVPTASIRTETPTIEPTETLPLSATITPSITDTPTLTATPTVTATATGLLTIQTMHRISLLITPHSQALRLTSIPLYTTIQVISKATGFEEIYPEWLYVTYIDEDGEELEGFVYRGIGNTSITDSEYGQLKNVDNLRVTLTPKPTPTATAVTILNSRALRETNLRITAHSRAKLVGVISVGLTLEVMGKVRGYELGLSEWFYVRYTDGYGEKYEGFLFAGPAYARNLDISEQDFESLPDLTQLRPLPPTPAS